MSSTGLPGGIGPKNTGRVSGAKSKVPGDEELKKLRLCIEKIKISKIENKANQIINNSYKGSINLTARLKNDNKTAKIIPKKL